MPQTSASADSSCKAKSIPVISCQVTRLYEMFWPVIDVINMGKETQPMSADEKKSFKATLPQDQKRVFSLLEKILEEDSTLIERVMRAPWEHTAALTCDLKKLLGNGQSNGQSEDMGKVSQEMPGWEAMAWDPRLGINPSVVCFISNAQSSLRQFNMTGLIQICNDFRNGVLTATPLQFPRHLWLSNGNFYDPQRPLDGLLQGEILICVSNYGIWLTDRTETLATLGRVLHNVFPTSVKTMSLAKVYNLTKVTPAFIAYVAVVVHHALTTEAIFSEICGGFNYGVYYNQIRTFLEAPRFASRAKVLLDWWNKRLFGLYNMGMHTLNKGGVSTLDELDAEAEADPGLLGTREWDPAASWMRMRSQRNSRNHIICNHSIYVFMSPIPLFNTNT
ncbi:hypothetical protein RHS01_10140 [Rhizoctonia solani]|uniref:Uncharacterized protein n=1 Tax=Rhizoctonia solani TaxID=456999 RepID=A0A8H7I3Z0_9AGAM|nr:hypothetical protein RHS01_10140 [Rhizoctonia solani]